MRPIVLLAAAAYAAASSPGGQDDPEAALRNLLTSLRPVYSKWKEAETPDAPPAPPAVGAAPWVRAATDLRDATPADVALAALGGAAARPRKERAKPPAAAQKRPPTAAQRRQPAAPAAEQRPPPLADGASCRHACVPLRVSS